MARVAKSLRDVPFGEACKVPVPDIGIDFRGTIYVKQDARAYPVSCVSERLVDVVRLAEGHVTETAMEDVRKKIGENVLPIGATLAFDLGKEWHRLGQKRQVVV